MEVVIGQKQEHRRGSRKPSNKRSNCQAVAIATEISCFQEYKVLLEVIVKVPSLLLANICIGCIVSFQPNSANALVVGGTTVNAGRTGVGVPVPPLVGHTFPFQVTVGGADPDPNIRLTDFTVQLFDNITGLDRATFNWFTVAGWNVAPNNLAGNAYYEAVGYASGIPIGGTLGGLEVQGIGIDLVATGAVKITGTSWTTLNPAPPPATIPTQPAPVPAPLPLLGVGACLAYSRKMRKLSKRLNSATLQS